MLRWLISLVRRPNTRWTLVDQHTPVVDIYGRQRVGNLMKRRVHGRDEYRLPTDEELQDALWLQATGP